VRDVGRDKKTEQHRLPDDLLAPLAQNTGEAAVALVAAVAVPAAVWLRWGMRLC
jgi:hypothetical protein